MKIICSGCKQEINREKEKYTHVEDWDCKTIIGDSWWHIKCFKKAMNRDLTNLEKTAAMMLRKAGVLYNNLPAELTTPQEEYTIC